MPTGNNNNFIPFAERTDSEQTEIRKKGGIASGAARREKAKRKNYIQLLQETSEMPISSEAIRAKFKEQGYDDEDLINDLMGVAKLLQLVIDGDLDAIKYKNELLGLSPQEKRKNAELKLKREEMKIRKYEAETKRLIIEKGTDGGESEDNGIILNLNL